MTNLLAKLDSLRGSAASSSPATAPGAGGEATGFQKLLDSLERLVAEHRETPPANNPEQLQAAIRAADDGFVTAMDLRKRLEQAFRGHVT